MLILMEKFSNTFNMTTGAFSVSQEIEVFAITPRWTYKIIHSGDHYADVISKSHLEGLRRKLFEGREEAGAAFIQVLKAILEKRNSYLISDEKVFHIEMGECVVKTFSFEPHYVIPTIKLPLPEEGRLDGWTRSSLQKQLPGGGEMKVVYYSEFKDTYYKKISAEQGQKYISRHPSAWLGVLRYENPEEISTASTSSVKKNDVVEVSPQNKHPKVKDQKTIFG